MIEKRNISSNPVFERCRSSYRTPSHSSVAALIAHRFSTYSQCFTSVLLLLIFLIGMAPLSNVHATFHKPPPKEGCFAPDKMIGTTCMSCPLPKSWRGNECVNVPLPGQDPDPIGGNDPVPVDILPPTLSGPEISGLNRGFQSCSATSNSSDPINSATGNSTQYAVDYSGSGSSSLRLVRYYNSLSPKTSNIGNNWRHNYDRMIELDETVSPKTATVVSGDGSEVIFFKLADEWTPRPGVLATLTFEADIWSYSDANDNVETYNKSAGSTIAPIASRLARSGRGIIFNYVAGKLEKVTDDFGHALTFAYDSSGRLKTITDPALKVIKYTYLNNNLDNVIYQDLSKIQYIYDKPEFPSSLTGIIDQENHRFTTWTFDETGRATGSSSGDGIAENVSIVYNSDGSSTYTDTLGQARTYQHIDVNGVQKVSRIDGPKCLSCGESNRSTTYDDNGFKDITIDYNGRITDFDYNEFGLVEQVIEAQGTTEERTIKTVWHPEFRVPICVISSLSTTRNRYTAKGLIEDRTLVDTTDPTLFPTAASKTCEAISTRGDGSVLNTRTTTFTYYENSLLKTINGPRQDVIDITSYTYDNIGTISSVKNALGHTTSYPIYNAHGRPKKIVGPNGLVTLISYDAMGRKDIVMVGKEVTDFDYYLNGKLDKVTLPNGSFLDYRYDNAQRLTDIYDQLNNHKQFTLNELNSLTKVDTNDPLGVMMRTQSAIYDVENHLKKSIGAVNQTTEFIEHDGNGNVKKTRDPALNDTRYTYDALDRIKTITDADLGVTTYSYDANNNILSIEDPRNNVTTYQYDGLGNRIQKNNPDTGVTKYTAHDGAGNIISSTNALGKTTLAKFDALNRIDLISYNDGTTTDYVYDVGLNAKGLLSSVSYNGATYVGIITDSWSYDEHARILIKSLSNDGVVLTSTYTYDRISGELKAETTPGGHVVEYTYVDSQLNTISLDGRVQLANIGYDAFGPATHWTWGNRAEYSRYFDQDGQLESYPQGRGSVKNSYYATGDVKNISGFSTGTIQQQFDYDVLRRLTDFNRPLPPRPLDNNDNDDDNEAGTGNSGNNSNNSNNGSGGVDSVQTDNYSVDASVNSNALNPISSLLSGKANNLVYGYDALNNRTSFSIDNVPYTTTIWGNNNQITNQTGPVTKTYIHNAAGNTISNGIQTYGYDDRGRFTSLTIKTKTTHYAINGLGQRVRKLGNRRPQEGDANGDGEVSRRDIIAIQKASRGESKSGPVTHCDNDDTDREMDDACIQDIIDNGTSRKLPFTMQMRFAYNAQGQLFGEYDQYGNAIQEIIWFAGQPVMIVEDDDIYYVHSDHLNTPRAILDEDNVVVWQWKSDPFGMASVNQDPDGDGENFRTQLRFPGQYYDNESSLHYNVNRTYDPSIGRYIESDPIGLIGGLNTYSYVVANPVNNIDQNGLISVSFDLYGGVGGGVTIGYDRKSKEWFGGGRLGIGVGGGLSVSMTDNGPRRRPLKSNPYGSVDRSLKTRSDGTSVGTFLGVGAGIGPVNINFGGGAGKNFDGSGTSYSNELGLDSPTSPFGGGAGLSIGGACGIEVLGW